VTNKQINEIKTKSPYILFFCSCMVKHRLLQTKAGACSYFVDFYAGPGWTVRGPPSTVYKAGELHRKHPLLRTWRKHFVVLDQFSMRYFEDQQSFVAEKRALGPIPVNGTVVFDGGNRATIGSPDSCSCGPEARSTF
jgi:hypothetical protein